jgi:hypothetical protein
LLHERVNFRHARVDSTRARNNLLHARVNFRHARVNFTRARNNLLHARVDSTHSRVDSMHARNNLLHARVDSTHSRVDSTHARNNLLHSRVDFMDASIDFTHARVRSTLARPIMKRHLLCSHASRIVCTTKAEQRRETNTVILSRGDGEGSQVTYFEILRFAQDDGASVGFARAFCLAATALPA